MQKNMLNQLPLLLLTSSIFAVAWAYITRNMYHYNLGFGVIGELNIFPLINWTIGLAASYIIFSYLSDRLQVKGVKKRFILYTIFSIVAVIAVETIGYYVFGVHNLGTSAYAGLPICNCLHAPAWMQFGYFAMSPLYWLTYTLLKDSMHVGGQKQKA